MLVNERVFLKGIAQHLPVPIDQTGFGPTGTIIEPQ
jgi:hypothetical protein